MPVAPEFVWCPNVAAVFGSFQLLQQRGDFFLPGHDGTFRAVSHLFLTWLIDQDREASHMRQVSLLELYMLGCVYRFLVVVL